MAALRIHGFLSILFASFCADEIPLRRPLAYADLCGTSKANAVSPFETALTIRGASAPRLSFQGCSPSQFLSPFDSVKSFPSFLSAASYPDSGDQGADSAPAPPAIRTSTVSPLESALGHFDLDRRDTANLHDLSSSQPPSPKTPHQGESFSKSSSRQDECGRTHSAQSSNPIRGHPRCVWCMACSNHHILISAIPPGHDSEKRCQHAFMH